MGTAPQTFDEFFLNMLASHRGLEAIAIADVNGASIVKVVAPHAEDPPGGAHLSAAYAMAAEQVAKICLGANRSALLFLEGHLVLQYLDGPLCVTLSADNRDGAGNAGLLYRLMDALRASPAMRALKEHVEKETELDDTYL
eukprot:TRINITY_DN5565_c0_g1_i1.p4 TRINITY_DN5565_c0_g1~~TRINITY_DN5565_c0_g1_i1.p4  ORF type:complete len:141 (-),score=57.88 TRINITY_DN5565_c0_g1_i1:74-496(-)